MSIRERSGARVAAAFAVTATIVVLQALLSPALFLPARIAVAAVLVAVAAIAALRLHLHNVALQRALVEALTDPVTGLAVRRVAEWAIVVAGPDAAITVAFADVDRMHDINHGPGGHATGDRYLAEVAARLQQGAVDGDVLARLGGDEFVLITDRAPQQLADTLAAVLAAPSAIPGVCGPPQVSVGIARLPGGDPRASFGCSSLAMFTAKARRSRIEIYDPVRDGVPAAAGQRPTVRRRERRRA